MLTSLSFNCNWSQKNTLESYRYILSFLQFFQIMLNQNPWQYNESNPDNVAIKKYLHQKVLAFYFSGFQAILSVLCLCQIYVKTGSKPVAPVYIGHFWVGKITEKAVFRSVFFDNMALYLQKRTPSDCFFLPILPTMLIRFLNFYFCCF